MKIPLFVFLITLAVVHKAHGRPQSSTNEQVSTDKTLLAKNSSQQQINDVVKNLQLIKQKLEMAKSAIAGKNYEVNGTMIESPTLLPFAFKHLIPLIVKSFKEVSKNIPLDTVKEVLIPILNFILELSTMKTDKVVEMTKRMFTNNNSLQVNGTTQFEKRFLGPLFAKVVVPFGQKIFQEVFPKKVIKTATAISKNTAVAAVKEGKVVGKDAAVAAVKEVKDVGKDVAVAAVKEVKDGAKDVAMDVLKEAMGVSKEVKDGGKDVAVDVLKEVKDFAVGALKEVKDVALATLKEVKAVALDSLKEIKLKYVDHVAVKNITGLKK
ncbi:hypothetical protein WDU94_004516 [Cyamophila willieti]